MHQPDRPRLLLGVVGLLLGALCGALGVAPGFAAESSLPDSLFATHWYTVLIMGNRSGYSCQTLRRQGGGVESVEQTVLRVKMDGQTLTASREERRRYDSDLRLVSVEHKADQIGRKMQVSATREGQTLHVSKQSPEGTTQQDLALPEGFGQELNVLQALARGDLHQGWTGAFTTFDADLSQIDTISVTVTAPAAKGWIISSKSKLLSLESRTWLDADGTVLRQEVPGMMGMALELATEQQALANLSPMLLSSEIPVKCSFMSGRQLQSITLRATGRTSPAAEMIPTNARQKVTADGDKATVVVEAETVPDLTVKLPVTAPELQPFLQPSEMAQSTDPRIVGKAREIVGDETDAWQATRKLLHWVNRQMRKVASEPKPMSALEILQALEGDCTEHAILLAALAQAVGIPARVNAGLAYDAQAYHYHAWDELYVGRWVEVDPTWNEETVDAGHLLLSSAALDATSMARLSLASGKTMGSLDLEVIDCRGRM